MNYILHILIVIALYSILATSLDLVVGYTGIPALGHASFCLVGAYTSSLLAVRMGVTPWLGMLAGACAAGLAAAVVAIPAVRLHGDYVALSTLGLGVLVNVVIRNWTSVTGGPFGVSSIPGFSLFGHVLDRPAEILPLSLVLAAVVFLLLRRLVERPFGRVLKAIREDEKATWAIGKRVPLFKLKALVVAAFAAGLAGAMYAHYVAFIDASSFDVMDSVTILLMVILGGLGTLSGSVLGAVILILLPELLRFSGLPATLAPNLHRMIYGLGLVILMIFRPQGIRGEYRWE